MKTGIFGRFSALFKVGVGKKGEAWMKLIRHGPLDPHYPLLNNLGPKAPARPTERN